MMLAHGGQGGSGGVDARVLLPVALLLVAAVVYSALAAGRRHELHGWSRWRTASWLTGVLLLVLAVVPGTLPFPAGDFRGHVLQHLIIGMVAPLLLVLAAPVTLLLRSLPRRQGRRVGRVLRSRVAHVVANPVTALVLNLGGLAALYFTPLYRAMAGSEAVHGLVHAHFLAAGYLFAWVVAGPDPAPRRPSVPVRLVVLGVAVAGHAVLSQLLYAGILVQVQVQVPVSVAERQAAAEIMYYGGDLAEIAVAFALVTTWRPRRRVPAAVALLPGERGAPEVLQDVDVQVVADSGAAAFEAFADPLVAAV